MKLLTAEFNEHYDRLKNYMDKLAKISVNDYFDYNSILFTCDYKACKDLQKQSIVALADVEYCQKNIEIVNTELKNMQDVVDKSGEISYQTRHQSAKLDRIKYDCERAFAKENIEKIKTIIDKCQQSTKYRKLKIADICMVILQILACFIEYVLIFTKNPYMDYLIWEIIAVSVILVILSHCLMLLSLKKLLYSKIIYRTHKFMNWSIFFILSAYQSILLLDISNASVVLTIFVMCLVTSIIFLIMYFINCMKDMNSTLKEDKSLGLICYYSMLIVLSFVVRIFTNNSVVNCIMATILSIFTVIEFLYLIRVVCLNSKKYTKEDILNVIISAILVVISGCDIIYLFTWQVGAESQDLFVSIMTVYAGILGGLITLAGVAWTINNNKKTLALEEKKPYKPFVILEEDITYKKIDITNLIYINFYKESSDINRKFNITKLKNNGKNSFGICKFSSATENYNSNIDVVKWIEPNQEFIISFGECSELLNSTGKLMICDILNNYYEYDLQFDEIYRICKINNGVEIEG